MALQRADWVAAGLKSLATEGIDQVRVERLALGLKVSKGSFYWHFRDRDELLEEMLTEWERLHTQRVIDRADEESTPTRRLERLFGLVAGTVDGNLDAAVHSWARQDLRVAARVSAIEGQRIEYITRQLMALGFDAQQARERSQLAYVAYLGWIDWGARNFGSRKRTGSFVRFLTRLILSPLAPVPGAAMIDEESPGST